MPMHYPKSEPEWLALRHQFVTSSESAALFGLSPYHTAFELATLKKADKPISWEMDARMVWGLRLQEAIAKGISEDYGVKIRRVTGFAQHPDVRLGASFDYEIVGIRTTEDGNEVATRPDGKPIDIMLQQMYRDLGPGILEIKKVDHYIFKREWTTEDGEIEAPAHMEIQVQHQLAAIQTRKWSALGVLIGGNDTMIVLREKDDDFASQLLVKVDQFWTKLGKGEMPPVVLPQDVDIIRRIYLGSVTGKVYNGQDNEELRALCAAYVDAQKSAKLHEEARKSIGAKILMTIGDAEIGLASGYKITAGTVSETVIPQHTRAGYRMCRVSEAGAARGKEKAA